MTEAAIDHPGRRIGRLLTLISLPERPTGASAVTINPGATTLNGYSRRRAMPAAKSALMPSPCSVSAWGNKTIDQSPANRRSKTKQTE